MVIIIFVTKRVYELVYWYFQHTHILLLYVFLQYFLLQLRSILPVKNMDKITFSPTNIINGNVYLLFSRSCLDYLNYDYEILLTRCQACRRGYRLLFIQKNILVTSLRMPSTNDLNSTLEELCRCVVRNGLSHSSVGVERTLFQKYNDGDLEAMLVMAHNIIFTEIRVRGLARYSACLRDISTNNVVITTCNCP